MGAPTPYREDELDEEEEEEEEDEGPPEGEEETTEQLEERLEKRAKRFNDELESQLSKLNKENDKISFSSLIRKNMRRKRIAKDFYSLLVLQKVMAVELEQEESSDLNIDDQRFGGEIFIRRGLHATRHWK